MKKILELNHEFQVTGVAENGKQVIQLVRQCQPDIMLIDVYMPVMNGLDTIKEIRSFNSEIRILFITSHPSDELVLQALIHGANGFLFTQSSHAH